jgi:alpha-tubulin suppressor-like RCC1 family protein
VAGEAVKTTPAFAVFVALTLSCCNDWESLSSTYQTGSPVCVAFVVAGDTQTCARLADGTVECWGDNRFGQLGVGDDAKHDVASVDLGGLGATRVFLPAGNGDITSDLGVFGCAITTDNRLSCWGDNRFGQLGTGNRDRQTKPAVVSGIPSDIAKATNGAGHTCAETADGALYCWGRNTAGQLGTGDTNPRDLPTQIPLPVSVERLSAGAAFTCARGTDGTLYCFGSNEYGQLGIGTNVAQTKPIKVDGLSSVVRLSTGAGHACAFTSDGIVSCWGDNREGQLGTGDKDARSRPVRIDPTGLGAVTQVYAGGAHTCAQRVDGSLWCWGSNRFGQLGTGDTNARLAPQPVAPDVLGTAVSAVYTGGAHTCAVKVDGSVWCWGNNQYGQLGVDVGPLATTPVRVRPPCQ